MTLCQDTLISGYEEVNAAAKRLLIDYAASLPGTTAQTRRLPLGRDEKRIYPFPSAPSSQIKSVGYDNDDGASDYDPVVNVPEDTENNDDQRLFIRINQKQPRHDWNDLLPNCLLYVIGSVIVLSILIGVFVARYRQEQKLKSRCFEKSEKNYTFTGVNSSTPNEKTLQALQINGFENPTYKFFERRPLTC